MSEYRSHKIQRLPITKSYCVKYYTRKYYFGCNTLVNTHYYHTYADAKASGDIWDKNGEMTGDCGKEAYRSYIGKRLFKLAYLPINKMYSISYHIVTEARIEDIRQYDRYSHLISDLRSYIYKDINKAVESGKVWVEEGKCVYVE